MTAADPNAGARTALQTRANQTAAAVATGEKKPMTIADYINSMKSEMAKALPAHITADRMARVALTTIRLNPKLQQCNVQSLLGALMLSSQLGLEPGPLGHCYLVPYGQECQFILGYKGYIDLMYRTGEYESLAVRDVCENDKFELVYGLEEKLTHTPSFLNRGKVIGYYLFAKFRNGGHFIYPMTLEEIERHRDRSKSKNNGPWVTDYEAMCRKTVIREAQRWMPQSLEVQRKLSQDGAVKSEVSADMTDAPGKFPDMMDASYTIKDETAAGEFSGDTYTGGQTSA